ncbi:MAG: DUF427 domain-containing protein [Bryobacterales bacterium]|jgi:uncharacterized protein (DUF427 family)|nr:DUF427 domain-containing protein [Bryobacterales bacterium]
MIAKRPGRIVPGPEQESVWDYPRPPRLEAAPLRVRVAFHGVVIADSLNALRLLETSHPPSIYIPPADVRLDLLHPSPASSFCEWKGQASYMHLEVAGKRSVNAAWTYPHPSPKYAALAGYLAFYPSRVDACYLGDEQVQAQPGDFYGGWITAAIVGPFKGDPGTWGW